VIRRSPLKHGEHERRPQTLAHRNHRNELGPVAVIGELNFVGMLPKTRSGKIMRRVLEAVILTRIPATSRRSRTKDRWKLAKRGRR
jgi:acyl-coenzyme A synthetase/AMP-(fatty) acid ligase